jgi:exodeoxyribonuclease VII large subunit
VLSVVPDDGGADPASPAPGPAALTVGQLLGLVDDAVRSAGLVELWVTGTVTGLRPRPKFTTFELVDYEADGSTVASVLTVGVFARHAREIAATLACAGTELADGLQVTVCGRLDLNPRYGRLRLLAERVDPRTTLGAAVLARDELVAELERTGRLRAQAARVVSDVVRRVGLVSSPSAAGRADVLEVLGESPLLFEVVEAQAAMSGPAAPADVARAITALGGAGVELIVVARGGGAKSDLAPWESREVAMAITGCGVPIWTALGHATDHTLADTLANRCLPTPSAAAGELVARARAAQAAVEEQARRQAYEVQLATSRRRARYAVGVAVIVAVLAVVMLLALRG